MPAIGTLFLPGQGKSGSDLIVLEERRLAFAAFVAAGMPYGKAAEKAGFRADYGWDLMQEPAVKARVIEIASEPAERLRAGCEADLIMMRRRAAEGPLPADEIATMDLRLRLLMAQAKLRGWIVDKREVRSASIDLGKVSIEGLHEQVAGMLDALEPGARAEITERVNKLRSRKALPAVDTTSGPASE